MKSSLNPAFRQSYAIAKAIPSCTTKEMLPGMDADGLKLHVELYGYNV